MPVNLTNMDIGTRYALQEDFDNGFVGRDRQVVIQTDDPKGYRPVIMDGVTQGGKSKVALLADLEELQGQIESEVDLKADDSVVVKQTAQTLGESVQTQVLTNLGVIDALEDLITENGGTVPTSLSENSVQTMSGDEDPWADLV